MIEIHEPVRNSRLTLRAFTERDEADMREFESLPEVARFLFDEPRTREDSAAELARRQEQYVLAKGGDTLVLAVDLDGKAVGYVMPDRANEEHRQGEFGFVWPETPPSSAPGMTAPEGRGPLGRCG